MNLENHRRKDGSIDMLSASKEIFWEGDVKSEESYKDNLWKSVELNFRSYFEMIEKIKPIKSRQVASTAITNAFYMAQYVWPKHSMPICTEPMHYTGNGYWKLK